MAQIGNAFMDRVLTPYDFESFAPTSAQALAASKVTPSDHIANSSAEMVWVTVLGGPASFRVDGGGDPTTSIGTYLNSGDTAAIYGYKAITQLRILSAAGTVSVTYFR